jgi:hypothetical protein
MFGDIGQDQVGGNRRDLIEPRFAELAFNVVFASEAKPAVILEADVGRFPRCIGSQHLRHVGLGAARLMRVEQFACLEAHQVGCFQVDIGLGDRELHALVLADRAAEHHALIRIFRHFVDEPVTIADTFGRDQRAFRIQPVKDVLEAFAFFAKNSSLVS